MWKLKVILLSAFVIINVVRGNPIDDGLHNKGVEESKFQVSKSSLKGSKLDEPLSYRLPTDSIPISYDISLSTKIHEGNFDFTGEVRIHVKIVEATDTITLHYKQIEIDKINIWNKEGTTVLIPEANFRYLASHDFLYINLTQIYDPDTECVLEILYHGKLRDDGAGFYWGTYAHSDEIRHYGATQFEINDARHAMPCYDEPGIRAVMTLKILHGKAYTALANTEIETQEPFGDDYYLTTFKPTPKMQTYLLAFVISDYEYVNATNTRIPQKIYATPMAIENGNGAFAASVAGSVLAKLEEVLGVLYPLNKMDHIALTKFNFGAMENFGLITYIDRGLLLSPSLSESSKYNQQNSVTSLIAHEYAHQWFGNIVSPQWWQYTWLNEGFATLFATYISSLVYPERNLMRGYFTSTMPTAFNADGPGSWAMNYYTEQPNELWGKFGGIGYQKSGCVLRMFMETLTPEAFFKGLNYYLTDNFMKAATPAELHAGLQRAYNEAFPGNLLLIGEIMYTWENQPGYPLVSVSVSGSNIVLSQRRYPGSNGEIYTVPITLATKTSPNFNIKTPKTWLTVQTLTYAQSTLAYTTNDWMIVNLDQVGYYRVDYDTTLWKANIKQLNDNHTVINPINRALLHDEFMMGWTSLDRVTGADALEIIKYLDKETEAIAWRHAERVLNELNNHLFGTQAYVKFLEVVDGITATHLTELGYEGFDGENPDLASRRSYARRWSCRALNGNCLVRDQVQLQAYLDGTTYADFNMCNAIRLLDATYFAKILNIIQNEPTNAARASFISSLGCSLSSANLIELLKVVGDSSNTLTAEEREDILYGMYSNSDLGLDSALSFINGNYAQLAS